jgi:hypothetical protein
MLDTAVDLLEFDLLEQKFPDDLNLEPLLLRLLYGSDNNSNGGNDDADRAFARYKPALAHALSAGTVRRCVAGEGELLFVPGGSPHQVNRQLSIVMIYSIDERLQTIGNRFSKAIC